MAQTYQTSAGSDSHWEECPTAEDLLREITNEINQFQAKKLDQLRTELQAFVSTQNTLVDDYNSKYPQLRDRWCKQHQQIETLYSALKCAFPNQDWKEVVAHCICKFRRDLACLEKQYDTRKRCCSGKLERDRDKAQELFNEAQARLTVLKSLAKAIDTELTSDDKLILEIQGLLSNSDKAVALYLLFFKLLPSHNQLMPEDVPEECEPIGSDDAPEKLCEKYVKDNPCLTEAGACTPPDDDKDACPDANHERELPWLIPPDKYKAELNTAWCHYRKAKDDAAAKDAAYKDQPDDLAALAKAIGDMRTGLDEKVKACLKTKTPKDECSKQLSH